MTIMQKNKIFKMISWNLVFIIVLFFNTVTADNKADKNNENTDYKLGNNFLELKDQSGIDYYTTDYLRYADYVYKENIKTVLLNMKGWDFSPPLIRFDSDEKLVLRFDDLDGGHKTYYYTIIHCDAKWRPSDLQPQEYIDGFYDDRLSDYNPSFNTEVSFTHYSLEFPNRNMRPKIPGNYIFKVFLDGDREDVVLTRKFMVYEQAVSVSGDVRQARQVSLRDFKQELNFSINTHDYRIDNPYNDITVVIKQNGRWDNVIHDLEPRSVSGNTISYDYDSEIIFDGGNEFRYFDTKSLKHSTARIDQINMRPEFKEVILREDLPRKNKSYIFEHDINGRYYIQNEHGYDQHLESDYAMVNFTLPMAVPFRDGNIYLAGEFTDWNYNKSNLMEYNYNKNAYQASMLLKQGYYNYMYMYLEDGEDRPDISMVEGNHSETENEYTILVYHRRQGTFFDRLIGMKHLNTHDDER